MKPKLILLDIMMPGTPVEQIVPKLDMEKFKIVFLTVVKYPEVENFIINKKLMMGFVIVLERAGDGSGYPALHLGAAVGEFLIYEGKAYQLRKNRP